jgi:hypothetical protein
MKVTLSILFLLCASAAFGQASAGASALSAQPVVIQMQSHPEHASYTPLGQEQYLSEKSTYTFGHGERPLWEVAPVRTEVPLGDVARALREEHLKARKAEFVHEN